MTETETETDNKEENRSSFQIISPLSIFAKDITKSDFHISPQKSAPWIYFRNNEYIVEI